MERYHHRSWQMASQTFSSQIIAWTCGEDGYKQVSCCWGAGISDKDQ